MKMKIEEEKEKEPIIMKEDSERKINSNINPNQNYLNIDSILQKLLNSRK